jgi:hypothetical protein
VTYEKRIIALITILAKSVQNQAFAPSKRACRVDSSIVSGGIATNGLRLSRPKPRWMPFFPSASSSNATRRLR